jgi:hypothetical protein
MDQMAFSTSEFFNAKYANDRMTQIKPLKIREIRRFAVAPSRHVPDQPIRQVTLRRP